MSYLVLARKHRPQTFDDVIGQEHITNLLIKGIETGHLAHAYLFSGPRGVGKTTCARILAMCLNCEDGPQATPPADSIICREIAEGRSFDVLEIDGASNRGIDEIRMLRENISFAPTVAKFKIYIVDEVHMLTTEAFNALLKTLEEPPAHVKFIFATTEPNKLPQTIISRCQRFDFKRIAMNRIVDGLKAVSKKEKYKIDESALFSIAKAAQGGDHTEDGAMVGTAKYLAPEQVQGHPVDPRTDVYALGIVLYEALTGVAPFQGDTDTATAIARLTNDPVRPRQLRPDIPEAVEAVIGKALARRPEDRFPTAATMRAALMAAGADPSKARAVAQAAVATARPVPTPPVHQHPERSDGGLSAGIDPGSRSHDTGKRGAIGVVVILLVIVIAAGAAMYVGFEGSPFTDQALAVSGLSTLDPPPGSGGENDDLLPNLVDADASTVWKTETYRNRDVTVLKPGVGLVVSLESTTQLTALNIDSPNRGWRAEILVHDGPPPAERAGWGDPVATIESGSAGVTEVDLQGRRGDQVMVWFTDVGEDHAVAVGNIEVRGR